MDVAAESRREGVGELIERGDAVGVALIGVAEEEAGGEVDRPRFVEREADGADGRGAGKEPPAPSRGVDEGDAQFAFEDVEVALDGARAVVELLGELADGEALGVLSQAVLDLDQAGGPANLLGHRSLLLSFRRPLASGWLTERRIVAQRDR